MRKRAHNLVHALLCLAVLAGFTSAIDADEVAVGTGGAFDGTTNGSDYGLDSTSSIPGAEESLRLRAGGAGGGQGATGLDGSGPTGIGGRSGPGGTGGGSGGTKAGASGCPSTLDASLTPLKVAYTISDFTGLGAATGNNFNSESGSESDEANRVEREFRALFDDLEATGGICGRKVEARGFRVPFADNTDENRLLQRCVEIAEDYGAAYVIDTSVFAGPATQQCFAQHGVVLIAIASGLNRAFLSELLPYIAATWAPIDRQFSAVVPKLQEVGYFVDGMKLGVYLDEEPNLDGPYEQILKPALERAGTPLAAVARARLGDNAAIANGVLDFKTKNVTHVIFVGNVTNFLTFSNTAEGQGMRPRYALTDYLYVLPSAAALALASQMANAVGVSVCNVQLCVVDDANRSANPGDAPWDPNDLSPGMRRCLDELSRIRKTNYHRPAEAGASGRYLSVCNHFFLWRDALRTAGRNVSAAGFAGGLRSLGQGYLSSMVYATDYADGLQASASHFAAGIFNEVCRCYVRHTAWTRVG